MIGGWWGVAGDEVGCWAGWDRGAKRSWGWRVLAMTAVQAMQSVSALLAVKAKLAGTALLARGLWSDVDTRWAESKDLLERDSCVTRTAALVRPRSAQ